MKRMIKNNIEGICIIVFVVAYTIIVNKLYE